MAESIEEMEAALELYKQAIDSGQITKEQLAEFPAGMGRTTPFSFEALQTLKELDPAAYPQRLEDALRISRVMFPHIEQK
ncbi:hypothetical protein [Roseovarius sp. E0-M6]|uniref:hypothetical protein n=1 Tax=Roseovarius sp. E0-M6 TaxID=3127118 RepID=UPI0030103949